jgi:hypothetical protein
MKPKLQFLVGLTLTLCWTAEPAQGQNWTAPAAANYTPVMANTTTGNLTGNLRVPANLTLTIGTNGTLFAQPNATVDLGNASVILPTGMGGSGGNVVFGNATGLIGPVAGNGTATTVLRSDGAPAINLGANYTWTGNHSFSGFTSLKNGNLTGNWTAVANSSLNLGNGTVLLPASGVTAATYGNGTMVPQLTIGADGRVTSAGNVTIAGGGGNATPGGANNSVQFNNAGLLGGNSSVTIAGGNLNVGLGLNATGGGNLGGNFSGAANFTVAPRTVTDGNASASTTSIPTEAWVQSAISSGGGFFNFNTTTEPGLGLPAIGTTVPIYVSGNGDSLLVNNANATVQNNTTYVNVGNVMSWWNSNTTGGAAAVSIMEPGGYSVIGFGFQAEGVGFMGNAKWGEGKNTVGAAFWEPSERLSTGINGANSTITEYPIPAIVPAFGKWYNGTTIQGVFVNFGSDWSTQFYEPLGNNVTITIEPPDENDTLNPGFMNIDLWAPPAFNHAGTGANGGAGTSINFHTSDASSVGYSEPWVSTTGTEGFLTLYPKTWNYHAYPPGGMGLIAPSGNIALMATGGNFVQVYAGGDQAANLVANFTANGAAVMGNNTGNAAAAGQIGELIMASNLTGNFTVTSGNTAEPCNVTLTAGHWAIQPWVQATSGLSDITGMVLGIGTNATNGAGNSTGGNEFYGPTFAGPVVDWYATTNTTVNLNVNVIYTAAGGNISAQLTARRVQ